MFVEPNQVPASMKGREDNTHLNVYGARTIAGLAVDAIGKKSPGTGEISVNSIM